MPLLEGEQGDEMDAKEPTFTVVDVYDIASQIGKEVEKLIDVYGSELLQGLMPKVIMALEHLENLATRQDRHFASVQELHSKIKQLEIDKVERAENRARFERDLEQLEDNWRQESRDLVAMVTRLQDENRKLASALHERSGQPQGNFGGDPENNPLVQRLKDIVEKQRGQIRLLESQLNGKSSDLDSSEREVKRLGEAAREWKRRHKVLQGQLRTVVEERADIQAENQDISRELHRLQKQLGQAQKENEDLARATTEVPDLTNKVVYDLDDPARPRFTLDELKDVLHERNQLKAKVSDLEDELKVYRPKPTISMNCSDCSLGSVDLPFPELARAAEEEEEEEAGGCDEDAPVQGPLPYEPDDAPWKRKESSGIRRFFRFWLPELRLASPDNSPRRDSAPAGPRRSTSGFQLFKSSIGGAGQ